MNKEEKKAEIAEVELQQLRLIKKATALAKRPPVKKQSTAINRMFKVFSYAIAAAQLQQQKLIIASQKSST